jgi:hypothetical protein
MDKDYKEFFDNLTKKEIDVAQGAEKITLIRLDAAKRIADSKDSAKEISPGEHLQAEISIINQRRDAEIKLYQDIARARAGDKDSAIKEQQEIAVANAKADAQITTAQLKAAQEVRKDWQTVTSSIEHALDGAFRSMLTTTGSFTGKIKNLFHTLSTDLITGVFHKLVSSWVEGEAAKMAASESMQAVLSALHLTGLITAKTTDATMAVGDITTKAAQAAAGAFAATAAIPYVGPFLAPAAAAEADASVMAFTAQLAFEKGGIVPETQSALVHEGEMVLPKNISQGIQEKILNTDNESSGGSVVNNYHINAHDSKSFEKYLSSQRNRNVLADAIRTAHMRGNAGIRV